MDQKTTDDAALEKIAAVRNQVRDSFGKIALAMVAIPRYRHNTLADLNHLILEPLLRDRIAIAHQADIKKNPMADVAGIAIWASVSDEVDAKIREQIKAAIFPIRLKADEWASGDTIWLLDVIAPDQKSIAGVIANFNQITKGGELRLHPIISKLVDAETLKKLGAHTKPSEQETS